MATEKPPAGVTIEPGTRLDSGKYRIVRLLGRGGMGSVYEAENMRTHKRVAVKCVDASATGSDQLTQRLVREAQAAARIRHPNVVDVYDVIAEGDSFCLVMEYLEGEPLKSQLQRGGLTAPELIALLLPAMHGVAAAHKHGVIHRDLKPDNIFLARDDSAVVTAKVLDFGISKLQERGADQLSLTAAGSVLGTPHYMSMEQLSGAKDVDARSDVYAFGVILYEALTGRLPFEADTLPELIYKISFTTPPEIKVLCAELPTTLARLVAWAMARDRNERIESVDTLIKELEPFATAHGFNAELTLPGGRGAQAVMRPSSRSVPVDTPVTRVDANPGKRRWMLAAVAAVLLTGAVGLLSMEQPVPQSHAEEEPKSVVSAQQLSAASAVPAEPDSAAQPSGLLLQPTSAATDSGVAPVELDNAPPPLPVPSPRLEKRLATPVAKKRSVPVNPVVVGAPQPPAGAQEPPRASESSALPAQPSRDTRSFRVLAPPRGQDF